ncbi:DNA-binding SARP family transcriptional activator/tetratricopeptide (TPR) repeat protein [Nonomuraea thailandensis]|uniref:DNA-binding SARP family transcriptional activator/tetratricopeptide (TPR) repeat protein n=1 Tax=Nonomuraea thailandensis TaxID=1188745 RepID=A0A9X2GI60_9ACTN|nr:BTAD domain-containing putative transcriptional regulator [Nonomuraea thailandensis]MCP2357994.1 DNA-binding SARP family transcriptional activator/tetratricopeptide (TPR) repeat protein [Nonomuraea thailandensis]
MTLRIALTLSPREYGVYGEAWFGVLGSLEVTACGRPVPVHGHNQRELLALLLLGANHLVTVDALVESVWPGRTPATARRQIQNGVGRLRRTLESGGVPAGTIETRPRGYLLAAAPGELDLLAFEHQVGEARRAGAEQDAAARLRAALALWRGQPLAGIDNHLVVSKARGLQERRLEVLEECLELELRLGRHHEVAGELAALVAEHPLRERLCGLLMLALYRDGRTADALEVYRRTRAALIEELGLEPGGTLRRLEHAVLTGDDSLDLPAAPVTPRARPGRPRQLPPDVADLTGRDEIAAELGERLRAGGNGGGTVLVVAISGPAGVGKTTLAVHVAHAVSGAFPDGQLYVDLRGGWEAHRAEPGEVLARFLRGLGVAGAQIPRAVAERAEEYRSRLAGRRLLVVLDNAADEAQIRPLIPGTPGCAVLVTSRAKLAGLPGARLAELDVLEPGRAVELLGRIAGAERVAAESRAAREVVRLCGGLPLALRITGARLVVRSGATLAELAGRLADENRRLDELAYGDLEIRGSLSYSYHRLSAGAKRLLRLLARLYAPDFSAWTCAALLDTGLAAAGDLIAELARSRLLESSAGVPEGPGDSRARYHLHDLIRLFAREMTTEDVRPAVARALGGWLALAEQARITLSGGDYGTLRGTAPRWSAGDPATLIGEDPLAWYDTEHRNLVMAVRQAAELDLDELCWDLVSSAHTLFLTRGHNDDFEDALRRALACTRRAGNLRGTATMLTGLGLLGAYRHEYAEAAAVLDESLRVFARIGDARGRVYALGIAAHVEGMVGHYDRAIVRHLEALEVHRASGDRGAETLLSRSLGQLLVESGRFEQARPLLERALVVGSGGDRRIRAEVLYWLGQLQLGTGGLDAAESSFKEMLAISQELGDPREEAEARYALGLVRLETGAHAAAAGLFQQALALNRPLGEPLTDGRIRVGLGRLHHRRGEHEQARGQLTEALRIFGSILTPLWQARALSALGDVHAARGERADAEAAWDRARDLFSQVGSPEAARVGPGPGPGLGSGLG